MAPRFRDPAERFWPKVMRTETCWIWCGSVDSATGYGNFWNGHAVTKAHRWAYEDAKGRIPAGLHIDHLCRNRRCVNPDHLEAVTLMENLLRGDRSHLGRWQRETTHCPQGHEYTLENTWVRPSTGARYCRACNRERMRARRARLRGDLAA